MELYVVKGGVSHAPRIFMDKTLSNVVPKGGSHEVHLRDLRNLNRALG